MRITHQELRQLIREAIEAQISEKDAEEYFPNISKETAKKMIGDKSWDETVKMVSKWAKDPEAAAKALKLKAGIED